MNWLKKFIPDLKVVEDIYRPLSYTAIIIRQYSMLTTISQVVLPNTLT